VSSSIGSAVLPSASQNTSTSAAAAPSHSALSNIANSAAAAAVSSRLKDIRGHEYALVVFLAPVVLYYTIGG
jgi:hypothetical protein